MLPLTPSLNVLFNFLGSTIRQRKEKKMYADWKEEITLSLYMDDTSMNIENLKKSTKLVTKTKWV